MKSLNSLLSEVDRKVGVSQHSPSERKIIKCDGCGQSYIVPGYVIDYVCQCKRKVTELDATKLADRMASFQRNYIIKTEARDVVIPAVAHPSKDSETTNKKNVV
jgi:hypothetical protein